VIESRGVDTGTDIREELEAAFAILKSYGYPITLGISDEFGDENWAILGYTQKMDSTQDGDFSYFNVAADEVDAFDTITSAAEEAGCQVQGLVVKLFPRPGCPTIDLAWGGYYGFPATLQHHLNRNPDMDVHIETQIGEKSQKAINVGYKRDVRRLSIKNSRMSAVLSTWRLASWIEMINLEQVYLEGIKIKAAAFQSLIQPHVKDMKKITLHDCALLSDRNFELILKSISTLTSLGECLIVTPNIKGSPSEFIKFLNNDNIDGQIKYTGNVAEQVSE
jgi:hypothetical protein